MTGLCESVWPAVFRTGQTNLENDVQTAWKSEIPDLLAEIRERLRGKEAWADGGRIRETGEQLQISGDMAAAAADIYSDKTIAIDSSGFCTANPDGILICSTKDVMIRSSKVNLKGIIYAPNGVVRIESSDFNIRGRIIAKNIIYQGSAFTGETYDGDLALLN